VFSRRVSVVICTRNRPDKIGAAVASVLASDHANFDLTVIDQSVTTATEEVIQSVAQGDNRVRYIHLSQTGLSRAYNTGIRETTAPLIAFTDDDCIVPRDWVRRIEEAFNAEPAGELLYGQVVAKPAESPDGSGLDDLQLMKPTPSLQFSKPERLSRRDGFRVIGMGANFAARRRLFDKIGDFDEALGGGGPLRSSQDFDLTYRAFRAGAVILLRPEVTLLHDGGREPDDWPELMRNYGIGDGAFYSKHVRCGDLFALMLLLRKISWQGACTVVKPLRGHQLKNEYLSGIFAGIREGFKFSVDKSRRRYAVA
jgi:glycosyltransferase involved in cell wall biosynthesis